MYLNKHDVIKMMAKEGDRLLQREREDTPEGMLLGMFDEVAAIVCVEMMKKIVDMPDADVISVRDASMSIMELLDWIAEKFFDLGDKTKREKALEIWNSFYKMKLVEWAKDEGD